MIIDLISKQDLEILVQRYIEDHGGILNGPTDTKAILNLIENAEVKATWVVKPDNR